MGGRRGVDASSCRSMGSSRLSLSGIEISRALTGALGVASDPESSLGPDCASTGVKGGVAGPEFGSV